MAVVASAAAFVGVVVVLFARPSRTIRTGKYCDRSRPSYSNQKIKVPFSLSCPLSDAVATDHDLRGHVTLGSSPVSDEKGAHVGKTGGTCKGCFVRKAP